MDSTGAMPASDERELSTRRDTRRFGRALAKALRPGDLLLFEGGLGAGKTFLARAVARGLGVPASVAVTSPTFALVHELPGRVPVVHADLYRLPDGRALEEIGLRERVGGDAVVLVEWGERFLNGLGRQALVLRLDFAPRGGRIVHSIPHGVMGRRLLATLRACEDSSG